MIKTQPAWLNDGTELEGLTFDLYLYRIIHDWSKVLDALVFTLVPMFFLLDYITVPSDLLFRFIVYRVTATLFAVIQFTVLLKSRPGRWSYVNGYMAALVVGLSISLMTADLGGFDARYYAGLNLIIIAVSLFLPWEAVHSAMTGLLVVSIYILVNLLYGNRASGPNLLSNLYFMSGTVIISVIITHVKHALIKKEFSLITELKMARDALWGEMEIAKKIQTSLLPDRQQIGSYRIAASMLPAEEVGGDYYDIIETDHGEYWVTIGDVSGHGVESGLIMMMTQTSICSIVNRSAGFGPSDVLARVNSVIHGNIRRLRSDLYMTLLAIRLDEKYITVAGKHQDIMVYRSGSGTVEVIPTEGTWIGLTRDIRRTLADHTIGMHVNDVILLFTDGISEAENKAGEMFGYDRLTDALIENALLNAGDIVSNIIHEAVSFLGEQVDDITLIAIKKVS